MDGKIGIREQGDSSTLLILSTMDMKGKVSTINFSSHAHATPWLLTSNSSSKFDSTSPSLMLTSDAKGKVSLCVTQQVFISDAKDIHGMSLSPHATPWLDKNHEMSLLTTGAQPQSVLDRECKVHTGSVSSNTTQPSTFGAQQQLVLDPKRKVCTLRVLSNAQLLNSSLFQIESSRSIV